MDFSKISGSKKASKFDNLIKAFDRTAAAKRTTYEQDETIWYPVRDKEGNAQATIRFLPGLKSEGEPCFIEKFSHGFKGPGGQWLFENCPTTLGNDCPVCVANQQIVSDGGGWDVLNKAGKDIVGRRKRKQQFTANIFVISDKSTPENNGKFFKFQFGQKILGKIMGKIQPEFDDQEPVNVFDPKEGAVFRLSVCKVEGYVNYDKSEFDIPNALPAATIKRMEAEQYPILTLVDEKQFNSYDDIEKRFIKVEKVSAAVAPKEDPPEIDTSAFESTGSLPVDNTNAPNQSEDDYFARLAEDVG